MVSSQPIALPSASNQDSNMNHDFIMGSYSGSVGSNFNPASYTRHFLGSPISWRPGSFGGRFPQGSPSAQLFSSLDQPSTSSSTEELLNAFNVFDREGELCRDYTCCGIHLQDLHALLEHFEEVHVLVLDPNNVGTAQLQVPFNPQPGDMGLLQQSQHSHMQNHHQNSQHQHHQHQPSFDVADDMELELDLDNSTHLSQNHSLSPSSHSSPSSGGGNSPPHSYSHFSHATPYHSAQASPYTSQPPSPTGNGVSNNGLQSHQLSNHMGQSGVPVGVHFPHAGPGVPAPVLANPEEAFNSYARFAADYSSHMPGAQPNASNSDEAIVAGGNGLGDYPGFVQAGRPGLGANLGDNATYNQQQRSPQGIAPALLFASQSDGAATSTSSGSANADPRQGSAAPSSNAANASNGQKLKLKVRGPMGLTTSASQPATPSTSTAASTLTTPLTSTAASTPAHTPPHTPLPTTTTTSLLLSKPFKCPKPNCNKSYKQANGLKYHMTHGSCNFAPSKDLEHVKDLLELKRREKEAAGVGANLTRSNSLGANPSPDHVVHPAYGDLGDITESELREVEREAEKRLRPFACGIGDCQRRYKNMNGLRYHYQHSGDHGALGLAMLAQGTHECLGNHSKQDKDKTKTAYASGHHVGDEREGRRRGGAPTLGAGLHRPTPSQILRGVGGSASVPASRAGSVSRVGTPLPSPIGSTLNTPFSPGYPSLTTNFTNVAGLSGNSPPLTPLTAAVQEMGLRSQPHTPSGSPTRGQRTSPQQPSQQVPASQLGVQQQVNGMSVQQQQQLAYHHQFQELQRRQYIQAQQSQQQAQQAQFMQQQQAQQMQPSPQVQQQQQYANYGAADQAQRQYMEQQLRMMQGQQGFDQQQTDSSNHQQYGGDMMMV